MEVKSISRGVVYLFLVLFLTTGCAESSKDEETKAGADGTRESPITLELDTAHSATVAAGSSGVYSFTTIAAGTYDITVTGASDTNLDGYKDSNFTQGVLKTGCTSGCVHALHNLDAATAHYFELADAASGEISYTVTVSKGSGDSSENDPVVLTLGVDENLTLPDMTDLAGGGSGIPIYVKITTTDTGSYLFSTTGLSTFTADTDISYLDESNIQTNAACSTVELDNCAIYMIGGQDKTLALVPGSQPTQAVNFTLNAARGKSVGTSNTRVSLTLGAAKATGMDHLTHARSYYQFTSTTGINYIITADNTGNLSYDTDNNAVGFVPNKGSSLGDGTSNVVAFMQNVAPSSTIKLDMVYYGADEAAGEDFNLTVTQSVHDGSKDSPVVLTTNGAHSGGIYAHPSESTYAYYRFTATSAIARINYQAINVGTTARISTSPNFFGGEFGSTCAVTASNPMNCQLSNALTIGTVYYVYVTTAGSATVPGDKSYSIAIFDT